VNIYSAVLLDLRGEEGEEGELETLQPAIVVTRASYTLQLQQHTWTSNNRTPHIERPFIIYTLSD